MNNILLIILIFVQTQPDSASADSAATGSDTKIPIEELFSLDTILLIVFTLLFTYLSVRLISTLLGRLAETQTAYRLLIKRTVPVISIGIWTFAIYIIIAGIIDPPVETILAVGASVGIAVGFAAQDILKNIFGGIMIILDRPFQVGDKIDVKGHYGEVKEIGLRTTRITTPDDSMVSIPNAEIVNNSVSNANTSALDCQVVTDIYLPASTNLKKVKEIARKAAISSRYTYLNKPVTVIVLNEVHEKNFILHLRVKAYVLDIRYEFDLKSEITELIISELNKQNLIQESPKEVES